MDKKLERSNRDKVLRRVAKDLAEQGFSRTKPSFFTQVDGYVAKFLHIHKYTYGPSFRMHLGIRVLNSDLDFIALNGPSFDGRRGEPGTVRKYDFAYHADLSTVDRCATNISGFFSEVATPWFAKWSDSEQLLSSAQSLLEEDEKLALRNHLSGNVKKSSVAISKSLLGIS